VSVILVLVAAAVLSGCKAAGSTTLGYPDVAEAQAITPVAASEAPADPGSYPYPDQAAAPAAGPAGLYPLSMRTGLPELDAVLAALETRDTAGLVSLVKLQLVACGVDDQPMLACPEGVKAGAQVEVLPYVAETRSYLAREGLEQALQLPITGLYALTQPIVDPSAPAVWQPGTHALILALEEPSQSAVLHVREGAIVRLERYAAAPIEAVKATGGAIILAPADGSTDIYPAP